MKEEGLPSRDIEVATQNENNARHALNSWQRVRTARLTGDTCHLAPENELQYKEWTILSIPQPREKVYAETHLKNRLSPLESHQ